MASVSPHLSQGNLTAASIQAERLSRVNVTFDPEKQKKELDLTTVAGKLEFFRRWAGAPTLDPNVTYPILVTPRIVAFFEDEANEDLRIDNRYRRPKDKDVAELVALMEARMFHAFGSEVSFDLDGRFVNGYGRFYAISISHLAQYLMLSGPKTHKEVSVMDRNKPRSTPDAAVLDGLVGTKERPALFVEACKVIRLHLHNAPVSSVDTSVATGILLHAYNEAYKELLAPVRTQVLHMDFRAPAVLAAFMYALRLTKQIDPKASQDILDIWTQISAQGHAPGTRPFPLMNLVLVTSATACNNSMQKRLSRMRAILHALLVTLQGKQVPRSFHSTTRFDDPEFTANYLREAPPPPKTKCRAKKPSSKE